MRRFASFLVGLGTASSGCSETLTPIEPNSGYVLGSNAEHIDKTVTAVRAASAIYSDGAFWARVASRPYLVEPDASGCEAGGTVARVLRNVDPIHRAYAHGLLDWSKAPFITGRVNAVTFACADVTLDRKHIQSLEMLVNTVAHENAHVPAIGSGLIGCDGEHEGSRFTDGDPDDATKLWLVSYVVGDIAECHYLASAQPTEWTFDKCFSHVINGKLDPAFDRHHEECCAKSKYDHRNAALTHLRAQASWCAPAACR